MKTMFTSHKKSAQRVKKQAWFEEKTGVDWTYYFTNGQVKYFPIFKNGDEYDLDNGYSLDDAGEIMTAVMTDEPMNFLVVAEMAKLPLHRAMDACRYLVEKTEFFKWIRLFNKPENIVIGIQRIKF